MTAIVICLAALLFAARLRTLLRVWRLPLKNGEGFFLTQQVGPGFYQDVGVPLFRRYHAFVLATGLLDMPLALWLAVNERYAAFALEQIVALVISIVAYNFMVAHFSALATSLCPDQGRPVATSLQLSMEPRRLSDYAIPAVEAAVVGTTLLSLGLLGRGYALALASTAGHSTVRAFHGGVVLTVWVLYWQVGFLLLKGMFVRWRMPLPTNRTEDFRRWRMAWLNHKIRIFDAVRLFCALSMLAGMIWMTYGREWSSTWQAGFLGLGAVVILTYTIYVMREDRRLAAIERELKPVEIVKEFPRWPIPEGHYIGGVLYFSRNNPRVLVRSTRGVALNLAHSATHIGAAYLIGLIALVIWMSRLVG
ncbi:MAG TPA: hypothetical protein VL156_17115 [Terriglobales bacterium]|jgi:hypothetical protein|nr:hypothetical protein [Terriglobales bacterium]